VEGSLYFTDIGEILQRLGYEKTIETEQGRVDLALRWPGAPQKYSLLTSAGSLQLDAGRGRFLETPSGATGALHVVGILNLADVVQRLSLSRMFESGIPFHSLKGEIFLREGTIEVAGMKVRGSSSGFDFSGVSDVASQSLDGELVAILPVANNLPWVAALAGGLPVAAGVFVVSKVFEKQVNKLSSGVYTVSGSWDDPQVSFSRIFDDTSQRQVSTAADAGGTDPNGPPATPVPSDPNELLPGQFEPAVAAETAPLEVVPVESVPPDPLAPSQSASP
jgi:uncharacterized protein YhdP